MSVHYRIITFRLLYTFASTFALPTFAFYN